MGFVPLERVGVEELATHEFSALQSSDPGVVADLIPILGNDVDLAIDNCASLIRCQEKRIGAIRESA